MCTTSQAWRREGRRPISSPLLLWAATQFLKMTMVHNSLTITTHCQFLSKLVAGKKVRGRRYPWGTVNIEDKSHCDFVSLRHLVLAKHMQDLKDLTSQCHYEKYRCEKLTSMALNKEVRNLDEHEFITFLCNTSGNHITEKSTCTDRRRETGS